MAIQRYLQAAVAMRQEEKQAAAEARELLKS